MRPKRGALCLSLSSKSWADTFALRLDCRRPRPATRHAPLTPPRVRAIAAAISIPPGCRPRVPQALAAAA